MSDEAYIADSDPRYVYTFYAADGMCLYVGCTARLGARINDHARARDWWSEVARIAVSVHVDREAGMAAEASQIKRLQPVHNRVLTDHNESGRKSWVTRRRNAALRASSP